MPANGLSSLRRRPKGRASSQFREVHMEIDESNTDNYELFATEENAVSPYPRTRPQNPTNIGAEKREVNNLGFDTNLFDSHEQNALRKEQQNHQVSDALQNSNENYEYLSTSDLKPCNAPQKTLMLILKGLEVDEWPQIYHTLNDVRRLCYHHSQHVISSGELHSICAGVVKHVMPRLDVFLYFCN